MATDEPLYELPPQFEPRPSQYPPWATDAQRFRVCFALTMLIAERFDPIFCKSLYDDPRLLTGDEDTLQPNLADPKPHPLERPRKKPSE